MGRIVAVMVAVGALYPAQDPPAEVRKQISEALEKTTARGGIVFKGTLEKKTEGVVMELAGGGEEAEEVTGAFSLKMGKNGVAVAVFEKPKMRLESFLQGGKSAHRLAWSGGAPVPGEVGLDLSRIVRWDVFKKYAEKSKETGRLPDADVAGVACKGYSCVLSSDFFTAGLPEPAEAPGGPTIQVHEIRATVRVGKGDGAIRQVEFAIVRTLEGTEIEFQSRYTLTVDKFDPSLTVEVPADLRKMLE